MNPTSTAASLPSTDVSVLVVGQWDGRNATVVPAEVADAVGSARVERAVDLQEAMNQLAAGATFDLIVLLESRPGQFSAGSLDEVRRVAPLARVWRLLGSWCEGEERSARPPAGCTRAYWHQWPERAAREFSAVRDCHCPAWGLPLTATADERTLFAAETTLEPGSGLVVVCAARAASATALADACTMAGYQTLIVPQGSRFSAPAARAIVWDTLAEHACDPARVRQLRHSAGDAPLVAVIGFPRPEDTARAIEAGVAAVISKPFMIRDLLWRLAQCAERRTLSEH